MRYALPETSPDAVPEYSHYATVVSDTQPRILDGATAGQLMRSLMKGVVPFFFLLILGIVILSKVIPALAVIGIAWIGFIVLMTVYLGGMTRVGLRNIEEFRNGYTTLTLMFGSFFVQWPPQFWRATYDRLAWDYSSLWVFDTAGTHVRSAPTSHGIPPGFYPSPYRTNKLQLWTGQVWCNTFRDK